MAARASFDGVVLNALKETETTLSDYSAVLARNAALQRSRDASAEAARLVRLRYQAGKDGFLALLDAERSLATADAQLAASQTALTTAQVALFKALGGGWQPDAAPAAPAP
ncbi:MAG: TolC family protein [Sphingomonadales bacterium]